MDNSGYEHDLQPVGRNNNKDKEQVGGVRLSATTADL